MAIIMNEKHHKSSIMGNCRSKKDENHKENKQIISNGDNAPTNPISAQYSDKLENAPTRVGRNNRPLHRASPTTSSNLDVIYSTRVEVNCLLLKIHEFDGTSETDKNYRYLDEMLTRCMLNLDRIECNNSEDRSERKEVITGVNQAIAILERKLVFNSDIKKLALNLEQT